MSTRKCKTETILTSIGLNVAQYNHLSLRLEATGADFGMGAVPSGLPLCHRRQKATNVKTKMTRKVSRE